MFADLFAHHCFLHPALLFRIQNSSFRSESFRGSQSDTLSDKVLQSLSENVFILPFFEYKSESHDVVGMKIGHSDLLLQGVYLPDALRGCTLNPPPC